RTDQHGSKPGRPAQSRRRPTARLKVRFGGRLPLVRRGKSATNDHKMGGKSLRGAPRVFTMVARVTSGVLGLTELADPRGTSPGESAKGRKGLVPGVLSFGYL